MRLAPSLLRLRTWATRLSSPHVPAPIQPGRRPIVTPDGVTQEFGENRRQLATVIARLSEANIRLHREARTDALTGLPNRRALSEIEGLTLGTLACPWREAAVLFIDVDGFGAFNKLYGDQAGDTALKQLAKALTDTTRESDTVFRKGGEEFVAIVTGAANVAGEIGERYRRAIAELAIPHSASDRGILTVTIGVVAGKPGLTIDHCLAVASDAAMLAKLRGERDRVHRGA